MIRKTATGHALLDELRSTVEEIRNRATARRQDVQARLAELEAEEHALITTIDATNNI